MEYSPRENLEVVLKARARLLPSKYEYENVYREVKEVMNIDRTAGTGGCAKTTSEGRQSARKFTLKGWIFLTFCHLFVMFSIGSSSHNFAVRAELGIFVSRPDCKMGSILHGEKSFAEDEPSRFLEFVMEYSPRENLEVVLKAPVGILRLNGLNLPPAV